MMGMWGGDDDDDDDGRFLFQEYAPIKSSHLCVREVIRLWHWTLLVIIKYQSFLLIYISTHAYNKKPVKI